jgi:hypothetical protein
MVVLMPYFFCNSIARSSRGPDATIDSEVDSLLRNNPAIMASAITPGPIKAISFLSIGSSNNECDHYKQMSGRHVRSLLFVY